MSEKIKFELPDLGAGNSRAQHSDSRRRLLEETKLPRRKSLFKLSDLSACVICDGRLEADHDLQQRAKVCRKCLNLFARITTALDVYANEKARTAKLAQWKSKINF